MCTYFLLRFAFDVYEYVLFMSLISCYRCNFMALDCVTVLSLWQFFSSSRKYIDCWLFFSFFDIFLLMTIWRFGFELVQYFVVVIPYPGIAYTDVEVLGVKWNVHCTVYVCVSSAIKMHLLFSFYFFSCSCYCWPKFFSAFSIIVREQSCTYYYYYGRIRRNEKYWISVTNYYDFETSIHFQDKSKNNSKKLCNCIVWVIGFEIRESIWSLFWK